MAVKPEDYENHEMYKGAVELSNAMRGGFAPLINAMDALDIAAAKVRGSENPYHLGVNLAQAQIAMDKLVRIYNNYDVIIDAIEAKLGYEQADKIFGGEDAHA